MTDAAISEAPGIAQALITLNVAPGNDAEFRLLEGRLGAACQAFPGFLASELVRPVEGIQDHWAVRVRFDSPERLQAWLDSAARREWLEKGEPLFEQTGERRLAGGFGSWFGPVQDAGPAAVPPGWKQVMTVLLALYPTVMLIGILIEPSLARILPK